MTHNVTLRRQMILLIAAPTLVIYVVILGLTVAYTYFEAKEARQQVMMRLASSYASRFDGELREASQIAETTAGFMQSAGALPDEKLYQQLEHQVARSHLVYGACLAFEPGSVKPADVLFAPYVCRHGDGLRRVNIDRSVYDWYGDPLYTWFTRPKSLGRGTWSEPYFDEGAGNVLMATYSAPFKLDGKFGGVATVDIDLPHLQKTIGSDFEDDVRFFILSTDGRFVYDADASRIVNKSIFDIAIEKQNPALAALARRMLQGTRGSESIDGWDSSQRQWVFFAPIRSTRWVIAVHFPESKVLADVRDHAVWSAAALGVTLLLIIACIALVSRLIAAPITRLKEKVVQVGHGDLDVRMDETSRTDELRHLSSSFNRMTGELRAHVARLATEQAARARIEHDLDIAREIQQSLLPAHKPDLPGFEFAGWSRPANQTGGDYYDWQTLPSGNTLVTLADVTGHGVGPALVTAVCRAYVRAGFSTGRELYELMGHLNDLLVADLPDDRFVTCAAALLDPKKQSIEMLSAGHGPIFHYRALDRKLTEYDANGIPLGVTSPVEYEPAVHIDLAPGDLLLFITDGFFEWKRADSEQFGLERLRKAVLAVVDAPIDEMIPRLYVAVQAFAGDTPQDDDVTAVAVRRAAV